MRSVLFAFVVLAGCTRAGTGHESPPGEPTPTQVGAAPITATTPAPTPPPKTTTRVELTSVTLADDCGGTPPWTAPAQPAKHEDPPPPKSKAKTDAKGASFRSERRRCEQTSMQLAIITTAAATIHVKSVELFDDAGHSLGTLAATKPTRWSDASATYEAWNEAVAAGTTSNVSYVLAQPNWDQIGDRWNRTYTLKTVLSIDGVDQTAQKDVTVSAPASLPPNVKT